jgi:hypothetical protein
MNADHRMAGDFGEGIFDGVKTGDSACHQDLRNNKIILQAADLPKIDVFFGKDRNDVNAFQGFREAFYAAAQDGFSIQVEELLGNVGPHPGTAAAGYDDGISGNHIAKLR